MEHLWQALLSEFQLQYEVHICFRFCWSFMHAHDCSYGSFRSCCIFHPCSSTPTVQTRIDDVPWHACANPGRANGSCSDISGCRYELCAFVFIFSIPWIKPQRALLTHYSYVLKSCERASLRHTPSSHVEIAASQCVYVYVCVPGLCDAVVFSPLFSL